MLLEVLEVLELLELLELLEVLELLELCEAKEPYQRRSCSCGSECALRTIVLLLSYYYSIINSISRLL